MIVRVELYSQERFRLWIDVDVPDGIKNQMKHIIQSVRNYCRNNRLRKVDSIGVVVGGKMKYIGVKPVRRRRKKKDGTSM